MSTYTLYTSVFVTTDFVGFHRWHDAPKAVDYLRDLHRHKFGVRVEIGVDHDDRDIEYHLLLEAVRGIIGPLGLGQRLNQDPRMSCEQMAKYILGALQATYDERAFFRVEVNEDGENGSIVEAWLTDGTAQKGK